MEPEFLNQESKLPTKIIILNGPPGSGKDTLGAMLNNFLHRNGHKDVFLCSFKERLIEIALAISGMDRTEWNIAYTQKETPHPKLFNLSPRQFLIKISEDCIKPVFGADYFGQSVTIFQGLNIFTDGGFVEELEPLIKKYGAENVIIIRLHRPKHTFKNDSRNYIFIQDVPSFDVKNVDLKTAFTEICLKLGIVKNDL